jgi:hypothetical protein
MQIAKMKIPNSQFAAAVIERMVRGFLHSSCSVISVSFVVNRHFLISGKTFDFAG